MDDGEFFAAVEGFYELQRQQDYMRWECARQSSWHTLLATYSKKNIQAHEFMPNPFVTALIEHREDWKLNKELSEKPKFTKVSFSDDPKDLERWFPTKKKEPTRESEIESNWNAMAMKMAAARAKAEKEKQEQQAIQEVKPTKLDITTDPDKIAKMFPEK